MAEKMNMTFAVFNGHVNDADKRARDYMREFCPKLLQRVERTERRGNGIMAIFQQKPNDATMFYAGMVAAYVNE